MKILKTGVMGLCALAVVSCSTTPDRHSGVEQARAEYDQLAAQAYVQQYAAKELDDAQQAVAQAEESWQTDKDDELTSHYVYVAERRIAIAEEAAEQGRAEKEISNAETERQQVLLAIREAEVNRAQNRNRELEQTLADLESEMETIKTKETDEGIVLTLQDILFNTSESDLKPGASATLDKVASFLNNYERRQLEIKGYTDSTGPEEYNQSLSERRAQSVEEALVIRGVDPGRIDTTGYGERYPVAPNDSAVGRQQNRRVEILIANPDSASSTSDS